MSEAPTARELSVGIVGLGRMGLSHLSILRPHPQVRIVGISDTSRYVLDVMRRYTGLDTFRDHRALLDSVAPEAVVVATPSGTHAEICEHVLTSGASVFLEKPLALTVESGARMVELAAGAGVITQVGYHLRFVPSFEEARRWYRQGVIGRAHHFHVSAHGPTVLRPKGSTWRARRSEGGGCLYDYASHAADLAGFLFGRPESVGGAIIRSVFSRDADDEVYTSMYYSGGLTGQLSANWSDATQRKMSVRLEIWGTEGKITADRQECHVFLRSTPPEDSGLRAGWNVRRTSDLVAPVRYYVRGEEYTRQLDHFVECVLAGRLDDDYSFASAHDTDIALDLIRRDAESAQSPLPAGIR
jgi:predicted dehydrogenase